MLFAISISLLPSAGYVLYDGDILPGLQDVINLIKDSGAELEKAEAKRGIVSPGGAIAVGVPLGSVELLVAPTVNYLSYSVLVEYSSAVGGGKQESNMFFITPGLLVGAGTTVSLGGVNLKPFGMVGGGCSVFMEKDYEDSETVSEVHASAFGVLAKAGTLVEYALENVEILENVKIEGGFCVDFGYFGKISGIGIDKETEEESDVTLYKVEWKIKDKTYNTICWLTEDDKEALGDAVKGTAAFMPVGVALILGVGISF